MIVLLQLNKTTYLFKLEKYTKSDNCNKLKIKLLDKKISYA